MAAVCEGRRRGAVPAAAAGAPVAWAKEPGRHQAGGRHGAGCGSCSTGGCRPRTGRIRWPRGRGSGSRPRRWSGDTG